MMYIPNFLSRHLSLVLYENLKNDLDWEKRVDAPREEYWTNSLNQEYTYGKGDYARTYLPKPSHPNIDLCNRQISEFLGIDGRYFEGCFLNAYEGKRDHLGWHSDDDPKIDHTKPIAIITLYKDPDKRPRTIQFRGYKDSVLIQELGNGSLFLMPAGFQSIMQHRIPKAGFECSSRISLTFRGLLKDG